MPNMDDISYFGSLDYSHRGGIWSDALRREKHTTPDSDPTEAIPPSLEGESSSTESIASAPIPIPPVHDIQPVLTHSRSAGELRTENSIIPEEVSIPQAATSATSNSPPTNATAVKRRTWLSSVLGNETDSSDDDDVSESSRGRTLEPRVHTPASSRSTSSQSDGVSDRPYDTTLLSPKLPPPLPPRTSPSTERYAGPSITPPRTPQFSRTNTATSTTSPPTSSFFSTLKARAGDKNALSNTAKEAMKKWSVNWGTTKRDTVDETPDADDRNLSTADKRGSYADIRRNVEDRQRTTSMVNPGDAESHRPNSATATSTSLNGRRGLRAQSISGMFAGLPPPLTDPSLSTSSEASTQSTTSLDDVSDVPSAPAPPPSAPLPIHTQPPQARTMTIPGIHASHRGEVMSMGYVAEPAPMPENKTMPPAIQSVYRLWKNQQSADSQTEPAVQSREPDVSTPRPKPSMVPPPLPPRSVPTTITRPVETPRSGSDTSDPGSASAALKYIVNQDESRRVSVDGRVVSDTDHTIAVSPP